MSFRITGLCPVQFQPLFGLSATDIIARGAIRHTADKCPGFPDRIELRDVAVGETVLLVNYTHQDAATPYRASHAIFVREGAATAFDAVGVVPESLSTRQISLRAFDAAHMMVDAALVDGRSLADLIDRLLTDGRVAYLQAHYATRGCYAARIERA